MPQHTLLIKCHCSDAALYVHATLCRCRPFIAVPDAAAIDDVLLTNVKSDTLQAMKFV